jgi:hypothetical protein
VHAESSHRTSKYILTHKARHSGQPSFCLVMACLIRVAPADAGHGERGPGAVLRDPGRAQAAPGLRLPLRHWCAPTLPSRSPLPTTHAHAHARLDTTRSYPAMGFGPMLPSRCISSSPVTTMPVRTCLTQVVR